MSRCLRERRRLRRTAVFGVLALAAGIAPAEEALREFGASTRTAPEPRGRPVEPHEWARLDRGPNAFGPYHLREADIAMLAAARAGRWPEVLDLVKRGLAHPDARDELGASALVRAARAGADDVVRLLVQRGAPIDRRGDDGFTPLAAAAFFGQRLSVQFLIRAGADLHLWTASGQSALHLAASAGHVPIIEDLVRAGADPRRVNREGDNALDVAANRGQQDAMAFLIAAGVDPADSGRR